MAVDPRLSAAQAGTIVFADQTEGREQKVRFYPYGLLVTTADLTDVTSAVNTSPDKGLGFTACNTQTKEMFFATGSDANSTWKCYDTARAATITPA